MLLPGISGSFILLVLGKYATVLGAVEDLLHLKLEALWVVLPFALGCLTGLMLFARFLGWLLKHWHDTVLTGLTGLLLGSLWRIWPYQHLDQVMVRGKLKVVGAHAYFPESLDLGVNTLMVVGVCIVFGIEFVAGRQRR
jgi:putative membrane protein